MKDVLALVPWLPKKITQRNISPQHHINRQQNLVLKKSHTCEEGGAHFKNFFLAVIDELEKKLFKELLKWANEKTK